MIETMPTTDFDLRYPFPAIRCRRVTRMEGRKFGDVQLDSDTAEQLGCNNIGVLVENCGNIDSLTERIDVLANCDWPGQWLIVCSTKADLRRLYRHFHGGGGSSSGHPFWSWRNGVFTYPEGLRELQSSNVITSPVSAMLVIDLPCILHKARGLKRNQYFGNDRPQRIADFRAQLMESGWAPPLYVFTEKPAKSVDPQAMLGPYCLENWWFVDGAHLRVGEPPVVD